MYHIYRRAFYGVASIAATRKDIGTPRKKKKMKKKKKKKKKIKKRKRKRKKEEKEEVEGGRLGKQ